MQPLSLTRADVLRLFGLLDKELAAEGVEGEVALVGGAVMCLAYSARDTTGPEREFLRPSRIILEAAARVAPEAGVPSRWLPQAATAFLDRRAAFGPYAEFGHLRVFTARPAYVLAMKCASPQAAEERQGLDDISYLLRYLNLSSSHEAMELVLRYLDEARLPPGTRQVLAELHHDTPP